MALLRSEGTRAASGGQTGALSHRLAGVREGGARVYPLAEQWRTADGPFRVGRIDAAAGLRAMIKAEKEFGSALRGALKLVAGEGSAPAALRETFFVDGEGAFEVGLSGLLHWPRACAARGR